MWLLTAGGALFAAFPLAYATTFSGFYLAVMLVLFGLIVRAVSLEYRAHDRSWGKLWDWCFTIGSLLPARLHLRRHSHDGEWRLFGRSAARSHHSFHAALWCDGSCPLHRTGHFVGVRKGSAGKRPVQPLREASSYLATGLVTFIVLTICALTVIQPQMHEALGWVRIVLAVLVAVFLVAAWFTGRAKNDLVAFILQCAAIFMFIMLFATSMFPNLVVASPDSVGATITAMNAASSELTLTWMTGITCVGLPLVLLYHFLVYRSFRGRVNPQDLDY